MFNMGHLPVFVALTIVSVSWGLDLYTDEGTFFRTGCGLTAVPDDIPDEARRINLDRNEITTITNGDFSNFCECVGLSLAQNSISVVEENAFAGLKSLSKLILRDNKLDKLQRNMFLNLANVTELDLAENVISTMDIGAFKGLDQLTWLNLRGNLIPCLIAGSFQELRGVIWLDLSDNVILEVESGAFEGLANLRLLDGSGNILTEVTSGMFSGAENLETLELNRNNISELKNTSFTGMRSLTSVNLEDNNLISVEDGAFVDLWSLGYVNLKGNRLTTLQETAFSLKNRTAPLYLSLSYAHAHDAHASNSSKRPGNPWKCDTRMCWLKGEAVNVTEKPKCSNGIKWYELDRSCGNVTVRIVLVLALSTFPTIVVTAAFIRGRAWMKRRRNADLHEKNEDGTAAALFSEAGEKSNKKSQPDCSAF